MNFVRHPKSVRIRAIRVIRVPFFVLMNTISSIQTTTPITRHVLPKCGKNFWTRDSETQFCGDPPCVSYLFIGALPAFRDFRTCPAASKPQVLSALVTTGAAYMVKAPFFINPVTDQTPPAFPSQSPSSPGGLSGIPSSIQP